MESSAPQMIFSRSASFYRGAIHSIGISLILAWGNPFHWIACDFIVGKIIRVRGNLFWRGAIYSGAGQSVRSDSF
jgi:hypothetical protein